MSTEILHKTDRSITTVGAGDIALEQAGIVRLQLGPELVERFERIGDDLQLVLKDGRTITIRNFFVVDEDGERSDLVLEDRDEVLWWGQYTSPWSEFHFAEIEEDFAAMALLPAGAGLPAWAGLALVAIGGGLVLNEFGGGGSKPPAAPPVPPANVPPEAPDYTHTVDEDTPVSGSIVGSDPDGDTLTYTLDTPPTNGTVVVNPDGSYTYTPDPDYNGPDEFTVTVDDGNGGTTTSTVVIDITPVNDPVTAANDIYTTDEDASLVLDLLVNDTAPDGGLAITSINGVTLSGGVQSIPVSNGTVEIAADGSMRFVPDANYHGTVNFPYTVRDADGDTDTATVTITVNPVNDAPEAITPAAPLDQTSEDADPGINVTLDLPDLFDDVDGDTLTYAATGLPPGLGFDPVTGTITGTIDNSASQGGPDGNGVYEVTLTATDPDGATGTQTFTWTVTNPAPTANDDAATTDEDTPVSGNVLTGIGTGDVADSDPDGDVLVVTQFTVGGTTYPVTATTPGSATITGVGTLVMDSDGSYTFTPVADWNGTVPAVTYTISDGEGGSDTADLVITVDPVVDIADDTAATSMDQPVVIDVLDNDDFEGSPAITAINGTAITAGGTVTVTDGSVTLNADGTLTFTPDPGYNGPASFDYTVTSGGVDETASVSVQVLGANVTTGSVNEAGLADGTNAGTGHAITSGGLDIPAGWTVVAGTGSTANGTWEVHADGTYDFTLTSRTTDIDGADETNSFSYTITNGVDTTTQTVVITIVDDAPETVDDTNSVAEGATLTVDAAGGVLSNDTAGADGWASGGGVVGVAAGTPGTPPTTGVGGSGIAGTYGTLTLAADGSYSYVSNANAITADAVDVFTYTVRDADGDETTATLIINVADVTGTPTDTAGNVDEAGLPAGTEAATDKEIATGNLDLQSGWSVQIPQTGDTGFGNWLVNTDGTYSYVLYRATTDVDAVAETDSFSYTAVDANGNTVTNTVTITIVDDEPQVTTTTATPGQVVVDETTLDTASALVDFSGLFNALHGADGAAATDALVYTLETGAPATGLKDTDSDSDITLSVNAVTGALEGHSSIGNHLVFTITVNATGEVQLTQHRAVTHPDGTDHNDSVSLPPGSVVLRATATDGDGDEASAARDIGGSFVFHDDGPGVTATTDTAVYESGLPSGSEEGTAATSTGSVPLNVDFGADGAGSVLFTGASLTGLPTLASGATNVVYTLADGGRTIVAFLEGTDPDIAANRVFTVTLTTDASNNTASYEFILLKPLDHTVGDETLELDFTGLEVTDRDGDTTSQGFTVVVHDDNDVAGGTRNIQVDEDDSTTFNTSADATAGNTVISVTGGVTLEVADNPDGSKTYTYPAGHTGAKDFHGEVTVNTNGSITYTPDPDYSNEGGSDGFTYTTTVGGDIKEVTVTVNVTPVSDAPTLAAVSDVTINEDGQGALGLAMPTVADGTDQNAGAGGDHPERLGAITLTPAGDGAAGASFLATIGGIETELAGAPGGTLTIVIVDNSGDTTPSALHVTGDASLVPAHGSPGVHYLTRDEYESIQARPTAESHENFTVRVDVTSYEVDDAGARLAAVPGAPATQTVTVNVQAVTDPVDLRINGGDATYTAPAVDEDSTVNLADYLSVAPGHGAGDGNAGFDTDGSQNHWFTLTGLPVGAVVNGTEVTSTTQTVTVQAPGLATDPTALPAINMVLPPHFAGNIDGIQITLHVQDMDSDGPANGAELTDAVTLNLRVNPVADDIVVADPAAAPEDTDIAFLAGISLADTSTDAGAGGNEIITEVAFTLPAGFTVSSDGLTWTGPEGAWQMDLPAGVQAAVSGNGVTLSSTTAGGDIKDLLDDITVTPPGHSSKDLTLEGLQVTTVDTATVGGDTVTDTDSSAARDLTITITPVAERTDGDSDGANGDDVTMNLDHDYTGANGAEDQWFALGSNTTGTTGGGWAGLGGAGVWTNEDMDEHTFAVLTPELVGGGWAGDSADGSMFRYHDGNDWVEQTFNGTPVWVPAQFMDTLQFKAGPFVSGEFEIKVQAATVDYDDDNDPVARPTGPVTAGPGVAVEISGEAMLTLITLDPVANDVTMSVRGGAAGAEDSTIPLGITATTLDPSETVTITIKDIPVGATIHYGSGLSFTATAGTTELTIPDYNGSNSGPVSIEPPGHFSGTIPLVVDAKSVDGTAESDIYTRNITVDVTGVADDVTFAVYAPNTTENPVVTEASLDGGGRINLSSLMGTPASADSTDGSETITLRISGLEDGFSLHGATLISGGATGTDRIWSVSMDQFPNVQVSAPANFSGDAGFQVRGISTERDGDSKTMAPVDVGFRVSPSVDGIANTGNSALVEDVPSALGLHLVHQNGDDDERMGDVWIQADQVSTGTYTILLNGNPLAGTAAPHPDLGGSYIKVDAADVPNLQVQGGTHLDGVLGTFNFLYEVIDDHHGSTPSGAADTQVKTGTFTIEATAVTDDITLGLGTITGGTVTGTDDVEVTAPGSIVTINLAVGSDDTDGSEHVVRVVIDDVPTGVIVVGGQQVGPTSWVLVPTPESIGGSGATVAVQFVVSGDAGGISDHEITMQVQVKDRGDTADYELVDPDRKTAGISWKLTTDFTGTGDAPPLIDQWEYNDAGVTEDTAFGLADVITGGVTVAAPGVTNTFTVSLTEVPPGTLVSGMTLTSVNGEPTWTATFSVAPGADAQATLDSFLAGITITPPGNSNENNTPGGFSFNATLSGSAGGRTETATIDKGDMVIPVDPVTDEAVITINAGTHDEDPAAGAGIPVSITVANPADGIHGSIVDGILYVKVTPDANNAGGVLSHDGVDLVPNGDYYEVPVTAGTPVNLVYTPPNGTDAGSVTFEAYVVTQEDNAAGTATSTETGTAVINLVNNGVELDPALPGPGDTLASGDEPEDSGVAAGIALPGFDTNLVDSNEAITGVMLEGVPVGFLVYVDGVLATNAGGDGAANTWVLADGPLPGPVVILPPPHWSGEVTGMKLLVESGEATLSEQRVDTFELGSLVVDAVANGLALNPTHSFGIQGRIIDLNLNAAMEDSAAATASVADGSAETTTVRLTGMGKNASFYAGGVAIDAGRISYDPAGDGSYTITGLSQQELGGLGFRQLNSELTDQDGATAGLQIGIEAWTVESGNDHESSRVNDHVSLSLRAQKPGSGADQLLWTGSDINGLGGSDVLMFRYGEDLDGAELALHLTSIEALDLSASGANSIDSLAPGQVLEILGLPAGTLTITGTGEDSVALTAGWTRGTEAGGYTTYTSDNGATLSISSDVGVTIDGVVQGFGTGPVTMAGAIPATALAAGPGSGGALPADSLADIPMVSSSLPPSTLPTAAPLAIAPLVRPFEDAPEQLLHLI